MSEFKMAECGPSIRTHIVIEGRKRSLCGKPVTDVCELDPKESDCKECGRAMHDRRMKALPVEDRKVLRRTLAYMDNHDAALALWLDGFRPLRAVEVRSGMEVAYRDTDVFRFGPVGPVKTARVLTVRYEESSGVVFFIHSAGECDEDEDAEVWVKKEGK